MSKPREEGSPAGGVPKLGKVLDFMRLLWAVDHGLQSSSKRMQIQYDVSGLQRMMIRVVGRFPDISAGEVADILHVHKSTLTGALARLVRSGAIIRHAHPEDGRRAQLTLGAKGRAIDAMKVGTVESAVRRALARVSSDDLRGASRILEAIADELGRLE